MVKVFNCGIGMILIVPPDKAKPALDCLHEHGESATPIGEICEVQESAKKIIINGLEEAFI